MWELQTRLNENIKTHRWHLSLFWDLQILQDWQKILRIIPTDASERKLYHFTQPVYDKHLSHIQNSIENVSHSLYHGLSKYRFSSCNGCMCKPSRNRRFFSVAPWNSWLPRFALWTSTEIPWVRVYQSSRNTHAHALWQVLLIARWPHRVDLATAVGNHWRLTLVKILKGWRD